MSSRDLPQIAFIPDNRLSRTRYKLLMRITAGLRPFAEVHLLRGEITEDELVQKMAENHYDLVLLPWHLYLRWSKVEGAYGFTRTTGPTTAGYFADSVQPFEARGQAEHLRTILLDYAHLQPQESILLTRALLNETSRSGIRPLLKPNTPIYCETWFQGQGLGERIDAVLSLNEVALGGWSSRSAAIRICLSALWGMIYEEGPGKGELSDAISEKVPRAHFQISADGQTLVMRLCFQMNSWSLKDSLETFWPNPLKPTAAAQLLLQYSDFLRVHHIAQNPELEVVAGFFPSQTSERPLSQARTLWVEPISKDLINEFPTEAPGPGFPRLRALHLQGSALSPKPSDPLSSLLQSTDVEAAALRVRELKLLVKEKDELIRELRNGGVGLAVTLTPADGKSLLESFRERLADAGREIESCTHAIAQAERENVGEKELQGLKLRLRQITDTQREWMVQLGLIIQALKQNIQAPAPPTQQEVKKTGTDG